MKPTDKPAVGRLVRLLRQAAGMTREQLATELDMSIGLVAQIEESPVPPLPWLVRRLMRSTAMNRLPHLARQYHIPLELGDITIQDALSRYTRASGATQDARQLRQYFAPTLTSAIGDLSASDLVTPLSVDESAHTREPVIAFLDWCTRRGWLPSNPLRANGAHARKNK